MRKRWHAYLDIDRHHRVGGYRIDRAARAVIRAGHDAWNVTVTVTARDCEPTTAVIPVTSFGCAEMA
jgi:hypothetical protein